MNVPFFRYTYDEHAAEGVLDCLRSGWLTTGPRVRSFETRFLDALGAEGMHAVALNSCTAALHLALEAIGLEAGDLVFVPTMTFAATAEVVRYFNAVPVFVDTEPDTMNISVPHLRETVERVQRGAALPGIGVAQGRPRAIIPVHYGGQPCDLSGVHAVAEEHGLIVIEDAAHAFPAGWVDQDGSHRMVGAGTSTVSCFSFYANKTLTTGEGGMAVTADERLAARMRVMSLHGMNRDAWRRFEASGTWDYQLVAPGFKYNMTDIAAAIGLADLDRALQHRVERARIADAYDAALGTESSVEVPVRRAGLLHAHHLYVLRLRTESLRIDRAQFIEELKQRGVMCSVHWRPLHMHPYYIETYGYAAADFPVAAALWPRIVSLPLFPGMTEEELQHVTHAVQDVLETHRA